MKNSILKMVFGFASVLLSLEKLILRFFRFLFNINSAYAKKENRNCLEGGPHYLKKYGPFGKTRKDKLNGFICETCSGVFEQKYGLKKEFLFYGNEENKVAPGL